MDGSWIKIEILDTILQHTLPMAGQFLERRSHARLLMPTGYHQLISEKYIFYTQSNIEEMCFFRSYKDRKLIFRLGKENIFLRRTVRKLTYFILCWHFSKNIALATIIENTVHTSYLKGESSLYELSLCIINLFYHMYHFNLIAPRYVLRLTFHTTLI